MKIREVTNRNNEQIFMIASAQNQKVSPIESRSIYRIYCDVSAISCIFTATITGKI